MANQKKRLGRGLDALISSTLVEKDPAQQVVQIPVDEIEPNAYQPRLNPQESNLGELVQSIRQVGILQPITVRPKGDKYELVTGERRWRATRQAGLSEIPAIVRQLSDERMLEEALIENIQREDLNPIDRAIAYRRYCREFDLTADEVADRVGESRSNIANYMRLLELGDGARDRLAGGTLTMGHGRALLGVIDPALREELAKRADDNGWSVRALEDVVRKLRGDVPRRGVRRAKEVDAQDERVAMIRDLEERFTLAIGTGVAIKEGLAKSTGRIIIDYYSLADFERIGTLLGVRFE